MNPKATHYPAKERVKLGPLNMHRLCHRQRFTAVVRCLEFIFFPKKKVLKYFQT